MARCHRECDTFEQRLVPKVVAHDFGEECFGVLGRRIDDEDAEVGVTPETPDGIGLSKDGGLVGVARLEPERPWVVAVEFAAPGAVRIGLEASISEDLAGECEEVEKADGAEVNVIPKFQTLYTPPPTRP